MKKKDKKLSDPSDENKDSEQKDTEEIEEVRNSVQILENRAERFQNQAVEDYRTLNEKISNDPRLAALNQSDSAGHGRNN
jgi:hypothetical protein